jgi:hypothetical protein
MCKLMPYYPRLRLTKREGALKCAKRRLVLLFSVTNNEEHRKVYCHLFVWIEFIKGS